MDIGVSIGKVGESSSSVPAKTIVAPPSLLREQAIRLISDEGWRRGIWRHEVHRAGIVSQTFQE
jgi:hypothetical protein